jgi:hypothetical protein
MNGPAVTTGTSGDLILIAGQNQTKTDAFSAHTPFTSVFAAANANYYGASGYYVQLSSGSITPTWTTTGNFDGYYLGTLALKSAPPSVSNPTFSLAGGTYSSGLPQSTTVATSTSGAYLCVTSCSGEGCTPATPAASSPPTCSTGTQYSTNSQALSIALGYETFSALGTKSGDTNSGVLTSSQYYSVPLLSNFGQETLSGALGNVSWEGAPIGNGNGQLGWTDGLASPNTGIQFTLVQNPHQYSCTSSPCTVTVTSTTSGNAGIICSGASYTGSTGTGIVISMGTPSAGGTWKHSPASMVNNIGGGGVATATILADDCYYTASLTGGTTSIGVPWTFSGYTGTVTEAIDVWFLELHPSYTPVYFDTAGVSYSTTSSASPTGPAGLFNGTSDYVAELLYPTFSSGNPPSAITSPYTSPAPLVNSTSQAALAGALNEVIYQQPTWTMGSARQPNLLNFIALSGTANPLLTLDGLIDFNNCTSGSVATGTCLGNSTYTGQGFSWNVSQTGANLIITNSATTAALPQPIIANGTKYSGTTSTHTWQCTTTTNSAICGNMSLITTTGSPSVSVGFDLTTTCPANGSQDCGAVGGIAGNQDYTVIHLSPLGSNTICMEAAGYGCNFASPTVSYAPNTNYRVNIQENAASVPFTVTFTNGSAVISATNTLVAGQPVTFYTTGTLPTNFTAWSTGTNVSYCVSATGLSSSQFEVVTHTNGTSTCGATPIVAGSAGSGTQTAVSSSLDYMTVCAAGSAIPVLGTWSGWGYPTVSNGNNVIVGFSGEEPSVNGYIYVGGEYVFSMTGQYSTTSCF